MKNYICINNQTVELSDEQVENLKGFFNLPGTKLADVPVGGTFKVGSHEMVVLEHCGDTTAAILKNLLPNQQFGPSNKYDGSFADETCDKFAAEIEKTVGADSLCVHTVDLTAEDGLKDYGKIERKASLLTAELYRRYVYVLDKHRPGDWVWLATAFSTPAHGCSKAVMCVAPSGFIYCDSYNIDYIGVRPFCILKSNIFVSK